MPSDFTIMVFKDIIASSNTPMVDSGGTIVCYVCQTDVCWLAVGPRGSSSSIRGEIFIVSEVFHGRSVCKCIRDEYV